MYHSLILRVRLAAITIRHPRAYEVPIPLLGLSKHPKTGRLEMSNTCPKDWGEQDTKLQYNNVRTGKETGEVPNFDKKTTIFTGDAEIQTSRPSFWVVYRPGVTIVRIYPPYGVL